MEEQRIKYGPDLYLVTALGIKINVLVALWAEARAADAVKGGGGGGGKAGEGGQPAAEAEGGGGGVGAAGSQLSTSQQDHEVLVAVCAAVEFYTHHLVRCIEFLGTIFAKSPFFLDADSDSVGGISPTHSMVGEHASGIPPHLNVVPEDGSFHRSFSAGGERTSTVRRRTEGMALDGARKGSGSLTAGIGAGPSSGGSGFHTVAGTSPSGESTRGGWPMGLFGGGGVRNSSRAGSHLDSVASDTWMSADDNASWYDASRSSLHAAGGRTSHPGETLGGDGKSGGGGHAEAGGRALISADSSSVERQKGREQAEEAAVGCGCFGGGRRMKGAQYSGTNKN